MCEAEILTHGDGQVDFILIELFDKPVFVEDCKLVHGFLPISACPVPSRCDVSQCQPNQLCACIVCWEVPARLDNLGSNWGQIPIKFPKIQDNTESGCADPKSALVRP